VGVAVFSQCRLRHDCGIGYYCRYCYFGDFCYHCHYGYFGDDCDESSRRWCRSARLSDWFWSHYFPIYWYCWFRADFTRSGFSAHVDCSEYYRDFCY
jgi:hypothetical protein